MNVVARNPGAAGSEIGRSPARLMAHRAVTGRGKYVDDLILPRMADGAYVRRPPTHHRQEFPGRSRAGVTRLFGGFRDQFGFVLFR